MKEKFFVFTYILFLSPVFLVGQKKYDLIGTLQLPDKSILTYKLEIEVDGNKISGKSITDFSGEHRTESLVEGSYDKKNKKLRFKETQNLSTKSDYSSEDFCYIQVSDAKFKLRKKKSIIQGHFYGTFPDGETCAEGDLYLIGESFFYKKLALASKFISDEKMKKLGLEKFKQNNSHLMLKKGENIRIPWSEKSIVLKVEDPNAIDHDAIEIKINGTVFKKHLEITKNTSRFTIPFDSTTLKIEIKALNQGDYGDNTAQVTLIDGTKETLITSSLKEGEIASIQLVKN